MFNALLDYRQVDALIRKPQLVTVRKRLRTRVSAEQGGSTSVTVTPKFSP